MKAYTFDKFKELSSERKLKVSLDLIYILDKELSLKIIDESSIKENQVFKTLITYLNWINESKELINEAGFIFKIKHLMNSFKMTPTHRSILNFAVLIERWLGFSKLEEVFVVEKEDKKKESFDKKKKPLVVVLDNLRSAFNVGSIFRTAECLGVEHIYLTGYTPTPLEAPVKKTAMGTDEFVSWSHVERVEDLIEKFKIEGVRLVALETARKSINLSSLSELSKTALFFGNERFGIEENILKHMDNIVKIPMSGIKNSLNVSNAFAISVHEVLRKMDTGGEF